MPITGIDHLTLCVDDADAAARYYHEKFGFRVVARAARQDDRSLVVEQGGVRLILAAPAAPDDAIATHLRIHGSGVGDLAFAVDDAEATFHGAVARGARPIAAPFAHGDGSGQLTQARIAGVGDLVHSLIGRREAASFWPGRYLPVGAASCAASGVDFAAIDHAAICTGSGTLAAVAEFYREILGFRLCHQEDVATDTSAMASQVLEAGGGAVKIVLVAPAAGRQTSQIEDFLRRHNGPGVQHVALRVADIAATARVLRDNGIGFLAIPAAYYEAIEARVGTLPHSQDLLRELNLLVDRDATGTLLQAFTSPLHERPTFFFEVIERRGAEGFGSANIKALFTAVETEQRRRHAQPAENGGLRAAA